MRVETGEDPFIFPLRALFQYSGGPFFAALSVIDVVVFVISLLPWCTQQLALVGSQVTRQLLVTLLERPSGIRLLVA